MFITGLFQLNGIQTINTRETNVLANNNYLLPSAQVQPRSGIEVTHEGRASVRAMALHAGGAALPGASPPPSAVHAV